MSHGPFHLALPVPSLYREYWKMLILKGSANSCLWFKCSSVFYVNLIQMLRPFSRVKGAGLIASNPERSIPMVIDNLA